MSVIRSYPHGGLLSWMFHVLWTVNTSYTTHSRDALNSSKNGRTKVLGLAVVGYRKSG
jgi:hypothetical protein